MNSIIVTGATGIVGPHVVRELRARGVVTAHLDGPALAAGVGGRVGAVGSRKPTAA